MCFLRATLGSSVVMDHRLIRYDGGDTLSGILVVVVRCRAGPDNCDDRVMNVGVVMDISIVYGVGTMVG